MMCKTCLIFFSEPYSGLNRSLKATSALSYLLYNNYCLFMKRLVINHGLSMFAAFKGNYLSALDTTHCTFTSAPHDVDVDFISVLIFP